MHGRSLAGPVITVDNMSDDPTVEACLRYISQTTAVLPWRVLRNTDKGAEIQRRHRCEYLLNERANRETSSFQFRETLSRWALSAGNGYAEIERDGSGQPWALWPIKPDRVQPCRRPETGELYYEVDGAGGIEINYMDMFHVRGFGDGPVGISIVDHAVQTLGWARAAQLFGAAFFGNGTNVSGIVTHKKKLTPAGLRLAKAEMDQLYKGARNSHGTVHFDSDADFKKIGLDAKETQLVEVQMYLVESICRLFGVPPHKVMHLARATFSNVEHQAIEVVVDCIGPWVKRFEDEAKFKLFGEQNRQNLYTKMNMRALLRGDAASRIEFYKGMWGMGAYNANRIRELEDENSIGIDGEHYFVQSGYVPAAIAAAAPNPVQPAKPDDQVNDMPDDAETEAANQAADRVRALLLEPVNV